MTIKKAVEEFKIDEKVIRKSIKDEMLQKQKIHNKIEIPDNTKFIPIKSEIQAFLFQILRYKNDPYYPFSREMCPDRTSLNYLAEYLYLSGYITEYTAFETIEDFLSDIKLTDKAINLIFSQYKINQLKNINFVPISINPSLKIGLINIG